MELIRKYKVILLIVIPVAILVIFRAAGMDHFRSDAKKLAEASFSRSNIITPEKVNQIKGDKIIVNLGKDVIKHNFQSSNTFVISPDSILIKENLKMFRDHEVPILLYSAETAVSVRIWMLLTQMGFENLFILSDDSEPEALKYEFRPDTTARPEL
jgi:hypothetical protein